MSTCEQALPAGGKKAKLIEVRRLVADAEGLEVKGQNRQLEPAEGSHQLSSHERIDILCKASVPFAQNAIKPLSVSSAGIVVPAEHDTKFGGLPRAFVLDRHHATRIVQFEGFLHL